MNLSNRISNSNFKVKNEILKFEIKKLIRQKRTQVISILYLLVSLFWMARMGNYSKTDKISWIKEDFVDMSAQYMSILIIFICIIVSGLIPMEYKNNLMEVLKTTKNWKKNFMSAKLKSALLLPNVFYFIYLVIVLYDFNKIKIYLNSLGMNNLKNNVYLDLLAAYVSVNVTTIVCLYISYKLRRDMFTCIMIVVISYIMLLLPEIGGVRIFAILSPVSFAQLNMYSEIRIYYIALFIYVVMALCFIFRLKKCR